MDPELLERLGPSASDLLTSPPFTVAAVREAAASLASPREESAEVELIDHGDGSTLELRLHRRPGSAAVLWVHGGGTILGSARAEDPAGLERAERLGVTVVTPDYRLAPEHPYPAAVEDCLLALEWTTARYERVVLAGVSAGAGLVAATALRARDLGLLGSIAGLHLYTPMLDDRGVTASSQQLAHTLVWTRALNELSWAAYLGASAADSRSVPASADDLSGLPPVYIDVGELDLFRDESIAFAARIGESGGRFELHVDPGVVHGFDTRVPGAAVSRIARERRYRSLETMLGLPHASG